jgi:hypothetical protein
LKKMNSKVRENNVNDKEHKLKLDKHKKHQYSYE